MNTSQRIGKWSTIIGIMIVLNLFFNYAISLVYKSPELEAFCPTSQVVNVPGTQAACVAQGGQWNENMYYGEGAKPAPAGYCDAQYTCRQTYDTARQDYDRNVFVILVLLGALSVAGGNFFAKNGVIASGLSLSGVLSFIVASMRYWGSANDSIKLVILAVALGLLCWVAVKKFKNVSA